MTKEKQFEERLDSLVLLKALLIKDNEFDEVAQREYHEAWERAFKLLDELLNSYYYIRQKSNNSLYSINPFLKHIY